MLNLCDNRLRDASVLLPHILFMTLLMSFLLPLEVLMLIMGWIQVELQFPFSAAASIVIPQGPLSPPRREDFSLECVAQKHMILGAHDQNKSFGCTILRD